MALIYSNLIISTTLFYLVIAFPSEHKISHPHRLNPEKSFQLPETKLTPLFTVSVEVDTSEAPQLESFGQKVKETQEMWFPYMSDYLRSWEFVPTNIIRLRFDPNYDGIAYASGTDIVGSVNYYENHTDDVGSMIHEMVHVIQEYQNCPEWLTEGIADYLRYYKYEPHNTPPKPQPGQNYTEGYKVTAFFLNYVEVALGGSTVIYYINEDCRDNVYDESIWLKMTDKTPDTWWEEMLAYG